MLTVHFLLSHVFKSLEVEQARRRHQQDEAQRRARRRRSRIHDPPAQASTFSMRIAHKYPSNQFREVQKRSLAGIGRKTDLWVTIRSMAYSSRSGRRARSRRSNALRRRRWYVTPFLVAHMGYKNCSADPLTSFRARRTSASTHSSTRRSGSPASRASRSGSVSASVASVMTRRARRRSCTATCRL